MSRTRRMIVKGEPAETHIALCSLLWICIILFMVIKFRYRSVPDRLPGMRQVVVRRGRETSLQGYLWALVLICFFISLGSYKLGVYLTTPAGEIAQPFSQLNANRTILNQVYEYQKIHY